MLIYSVPGDDHAQAPLCRTGSSAWLVAHETGLAVMCQMKQPFTTLPASAWTLADPL